MRFGVIGCGYVVDAYMATWPAHPRLELAGVADRDGARAAAVGAAYGARVYGSADELLADPAIDAVLNLTSIDSHHAVTRAALEAGRHVYSEKPLATSLDDARALVALAAERGRQLACAPCNVLAASAQTLWRAVADGAIGEPRLVYAELDDNPIHLMGPEGWRSRTGAPWPYAEEYRQGCTREHAAYHLVPLCAMFGPVEEVTAFAADAKVSVAVLRFRSGVVARLTCSIVAPMDHRLRIVGSAGMLSVETYRDDASPVRHEPFTKASLFGRKSRRALVRRLAGAGGRPLTLVGEGARRQDKALGVAELADAVAAGRPCFPPPDLTLHVTELTLAIEAGASGPTQTTFAPVAPRAPAGAVRRRRVSALQRLASRVLDRRHQG